LRFDLFNNVESKKDIEGNDVNGIFLTKMSNNIYMKNIEATNDINDPNEAM